MFNNMATNGFIVGMHYYKLTARNVKIYIISYLSV